MNKKGFLDFDFEMESFVPIGLALFGAFIAYFTASGGFSSMLSGTEYNPGLATKIFSALGGGVIGYVWGYYMTNN